MVSKIAIIGPTTDKNISSKKASVVEFFKEAFEQNNITDIDCFDFDKNISKRKLYLNKAFYHIYKKLPLNVYSSAEKRLEAFLKKKNQEKSYDLVVVIKGEFIRKKALSLIRKYNKDAVIINIFPDNPFFYFDSFKAIPYYDYFFVKDSYILNELKKLGLENCHYLPQAFSLTAHRPVKKEESNKAEYSRLKSDISFIGSIYPQRQRILEHLKCIVDKGSSLKIWGKNIWDSCDPNSWIFRHHQKELAVLDKKSKIVSFSKISLNTHNFQNDIFGCNKRLFEITGIGGFQLVDFKKDLPKLFKPEKELATFKTAKELKEKLQYYLENEKERAKIAKNGYKRAQKGHSYYHRAKQIVKAVKS